MKKLLIGFIFLSSMSSYAYDDQTLLKGIPTGTQVELIDTMFNRNITKTIMAEGYIRQECTLSMYNKDSKELIAHTSGDTLPLITAVTAKEVIFKKKTGHYSNFKTKARLIDNVTTLEVRGSNNLEEIKYFNRKMKYLNGNRVEQLKEAFLQLNFIFPKKSAEKL